MVWGSGHIYAVITGDFIGFSRLKLEVRRSMPLIMAQAGNFIRSVMPGVMANDIEVFRGDNWQALLENPGCALRAGLIIRACIISSAFPLDTRMAVGVGTVDYVFEDRVSAGDGSAFRRSGKMLESMSSSRNAGVLRYSNPDFPDEYLIDALVRTLGALSAGWSPSQARAVLGMLEGKKQAEIAEGWPEAVSKQAVSKHLKNAGWAAILQGLDAFEQGHQTTS